MMEVEGVGTSVDTGERERGQTLALDLLLLIHSPLGLQNRVLKLCSSVDVAKREEINTIT